MKGGCLRVHKVKMKSKEDRVCTVMRTGAALYGAERVVSRDLMSN